MHFPSNEMNSSAIIDKFDGIQNDTNVIKIEIVNKINSSLT